MKIVMPTTGLVRAFVVQWWIAGTALFVLSVRTVYQGFSDGHAVVVGTFVAVHGPVPMSWLRAPLSIRWARRRTSR
jgi:hypothetical protein